ncbi:histone deacetylase [Cellulomonas sp. ICMP 17802]|uniref:histone deacetylase n=1 Tax=Cellulomonas sp. ICMP 17802 TaxID=3239199 RepID=UPI00351B5C39
MTTAVVDRVWYVAYGSNLSVDRFRYYLRGGRPPGSRRTYPGCRDRTEPERTVPLVVRGSLSFTGASTAWGGGTAVFDPDGTGRVAAAAYLLGSGQLADVLAQEMRRDPGEDLDLQALGREGRHRYGPGRYETIVHLGGRDGLPLVTLTSEPFDDAPLNAPSDAYLRTMATGLRETHGWGPDEVRSYLAAIPGIGEALLSS